MHVQLNTSTTDPTLQIGAIQQIATLVPGLDLVTQTLINTLSAATVNLAGTETLLQTALGGTGLYPLKTSAAAIATCNTPSIPVGNYTNLNAGLTSAPRPSHTRCFDGTSDATQSEDSIPQPRGKKAPLWRSSCCEHAQGADAHADLALNGQSVGVAGVPILNPLLTLTVFNFDVFKVRSNLPSGYITSCVPSQKETPPAHCHSSYTVWNCFSLVMRAMFKIMKWSLESS